MSYDTRFKTSPFNPALPVTLETGALRYTGAAFNGAKIADVACTRAPNYPGFGPLGSDWHFLQGPPRLSTLHKEGRFYSAAFEASATVNAYGYADAYLAGADEFKTGDGRTFEASPDGSLTFRDITPQPCGTLRFRLFLEGDGFVTSSGEILAEGHVTLSSDFGTSDNHFTTVTAESVHMNGASALCAVEAALRRLLELRLRDCKDSCGILAHRSALADFLAIFQRPPAAE
jgi:hypothetical protein